MVLLRRPCRLLHGVPGRLATDLSGDDEQRVCHNGWKREWKREREWEWEMLVVVRWEWESEWEWECEWGWEWEWWEYYEVDG